MSPAVEMLCLSQPPCTVGVQASSKLICLQQGWRSCQGPCIEQVHLAPAQVAGQTASIFVNWCQHSAEHIACTRVQATVERGIA